MATQSRLSRSWIGQCLTPWLLLGLACGGNVSEQSSVDLAITNVVVIDAVNGLREDQTVLIKGERVVAVSASDHAELLAGRIIDGSGKFLIPGLWDLHVHIP